MNSKFQHLLTDPIDLDISDVISDGYELFKRSAGSLILFMIVMFVGVFAISGIFAVIASALVEVVGSVGMIVFQILNFAVSLCFYVLSAGWYTYLRKAKNNKGDFNHFFEPFKYFGSIIAHYLILVAFIFTVFAIIMGVTYLVGSNMMFDLQNMIDPTAFLAGSAGIFGFVLLIYVPIIVILALYQFATPLIVDGGLGAWEAMETSRKVTMRKFGFIILLNIIVFIGAMVVTFFTCGLGALLALPLFYCIQFVLYDTVFSPGQELKSKLDQFGHLQQDQNTEEEI